MFLDAIKSVKDPKDQSRSIYDFFVEYNKNETTPMLHVEDRIRILGAGSDHAIFAFYAGVPAVYFRFEPDTQIYKGSYTGVLCLKSSISKLIYHIFVLQLGFP